MPEIRLGSAENLPNIRLGSIQIEEVRLGGILVWQNNQGPVFLSLVWDGTSFTVPVPGEEFSFPATSGAANFAGARTIDLVVNNITDPDNVPAMPDTDFIVGYRLQRPDDTWAAGDPDSIIDNTDGSPISEFGATLPGSTNTYDPATGEFTAGSRTITSTTIPALLRDTDTAGNIVDLETQQFIDDGEWELFVVDSRGGESSMGTIDVTLNYIAPTNSAQGQGTGGTTNGSLITFGTGIQSFRNATINGPTDVTVSALNNDAGGPLSTDTTTSTNTWTCMTGCTGGPFNTDTASLPIPQNAAGNGTEAVWQLVQRGRAWDGNTTVFSTPTMFSFRSGASCAPGYTASGTTNFTYFSDSTNTATCDPLAMAPDTSTITVSCAPMANCGGFSWASGTSYSAPNPPCNTATNTRETATVSISGTTQGTIAVTASGSRGFQATFPQVASTCDVTISCNNAPTALDARCGTTQTVAVNCSGDNCTAAMGTPSAPCNAPVLTIANTNPDNYRGGGVTGGTACSAPGGTSTLTVTYTAIQPEWGPICNATVPAGTDRGAVIGAAGCTFGVTNGVAINGAFGAVNSTAGGRPGPCNPGDTFNVVASGAGGANPCRATFFAGGCALNANNSATVTCV